MSFCIFSRSHLENWPKITPKRFKIAFFPDNWDPPDILGRTDLHSGYFYFFPFFWDLDIRDLRAWAHFFSELFVSACKEHRAITRYMFTWVGNLEISNVLYIFNQCQCAAVRDQEATRALRFDCSIHDVKMKSQGCFWIRVGRKLKIFCWEVVEKLSDSEMEPAKTHHLK